MKKLRRWMLPLFALALVGAGPCPNIKLTPDLLQVPDLTRTLFPESEPAPPPSGEDDQSPLPDLTDEDVADSSQLFLISDEPYDGDEGNPWGSFLMAAEPPRPPAEGQRDANRRDAEKQEKDRRDRDDPLDLEKRTVEFNLEREKEAARRKDVEQKLDQRSVAEIGKIRSENSCGRIPKEKIVVIGGGAAGTAACPDSGLILSESNAWELRGDLPVLQSDLPGFPAAGLPDPRTFAPGLKALERIPASAVVAAWKSSQSDRKIRLVNVAVDGAEQQPDQSWVLKAGTLKQGASAVILAVGVAQQNEVPNVTGRAALQGARRLTFGSEIFAENIPPIAPGEKLLIIGNGGGGFQACQILLARVGAKGSITVAGRPPGFEATLQRFPGLNDARATTNADGTARGFGDPRVTELAAGDFTGGRQLGDGRPQIDVVTPDGKTTSLTFDRVVQVMGPKQENPPILVAAAAGKKITWDPIYVSGRPIGVAVLFDGKTSGFFVAGAASIRPPPGTMDAATQQKWNAAWERLEKAAGTGNVPEGWNLSVPSARMMRDYVQSKYP